MIYRELILCKEGVSVETLRNQTPVDIVETYVLRNNGRGIAEYTIRDQALAEAFDMIKKKQEGRTNVAYVRRNNKRSNI